MTKQEYRQGAWKFFLFCISSFGLSRLMMTICRFKYPVWNFIEQGNSPSSNDSLASSHSLHHDLLLYLVPSMVLVQPFFFFFSSLLVISPLLLGFILIPHDYSLVRQSCIPMYMS